ncbi:MAG TPA: hypothetical protein VMX14_03605 [Anaerolineae bacterium]|nr:hypothetical protein [Anaerolineae bacterium]HUW13360.1 hypothetical protein [Anaerolineae bacterium]
MRETVIRWSVTLLLSVLVTSNLLAQPVPPRLPEDTYPPPPTIEPYPWPTRNPYPWPTLAPQEPYPLYPIIPTRTPRSPEIGPMPSGNDATRLLLDSIRRQRESSVAAPTPTRDPDWEGEFYEVHGRRPDVQDVGDRQWSLGFLDRTGRPPTQAEWEAHYYRR